MAVFTTVDRMTSLSSLCIIRGRSQHIRYCAPLIHPGHPSCIFCRYSEEITFVVVILSTLQRDGFFSGLPVLVGRHVHEGSACTAG